MIVAATVIDPPQGDKCWQFHFINDSAETVRSILVESVEYEWGDMGNAEAVGATFGPVAPGESLELTKETDTEVRTSLTLLVDGRRVVAEFGKLYATPGKLVPIPILNRPGKRATIEGR